jgi:hypothetical protein
VTPEAGGKRIKAETSRFYSTRRRVYGGLLIFVVAAMVPLASVPSLRNRFVTRIHELKVSFSGETSPVVVQAGENQEPFPAEYERPAPPSVAQMFKIPAEPVTRDAPAREETQARSAPRRTLRIPKVGEPSQPADGGEESGERGESAATGATEDQPKYRQGIMEQEAYDLLLKSNSAVAELVHGSNPSLKFLLWDAAGRGDDFYWVRLKFRQEGKPDAEYIWQVQLQAKRIVPLNYNARSLQ